MRKKDTKFIEIKTPCQEDLANMDASTQGFFCHACSKEVIDFRYQNDREIRQFFDQHQDRKICGLFRADQVGKPLPSVHTSKHFSALKIAAIALSSLTITQGCFMGAVSERKTNVATECTDTPLVGAPTLGGTQPTLSSTPHPLRIKGRVWMVAHDTIPQKGGRLEVKDADIRIDIDKNGYFSFILPSSCTSNTIELKLGSHIVRTLHRSELPMEDCQIFITPQSPTLKGDVIIRK
jgi:hypothetical protein